MAQEISVLYTKYDKYFKVLHHNSRIALEKAMKATVMMPDVIARD